jgi:hypothetical protein
MRQGRHGTKVLGLLLIAALALMAFTAAAAQAGEFRVEGKTFATHKLASETVSGNVAEGELLVPGLLTVNCTGGTFTGTAFAGGNASATILYSGCTVLGNKFCFPFEDKAKMEGNLAENKGFIKASGTGKLVLMGTSHYLLVESTEFATIYLTKSTSGCTLPLENKVSGSTVLELPGALANTVNQEIKTIAQATLESLFEAAKGENKVNTLLYGNQLAWLDGGTAQAALSGALKGKTWGGE